MTMDQEMDMNQDLQRYSFHATWDLKRNLAKPFDILMRQIDQHIKDETHETFLEEGLLFKSYLCMSGIGENSNKDNKNATRCLTEVIAKIDTWPNSPKKDGFLSVAYALEAWIDMDKTESRLQDLLKLYSNNRNETRKRFEATIHYIKGYSLSRLGANRCAECIDEFRKAKEKCPENHEYLFSFALMTRRFNGNEVGEEVKEMLLEVLEKKPDYLYAKVLLAGYLATLDGNTVGATELLEEITTTLTANDSVTPENMKILGHVMKTYIKIEKYDKAEETYNMACGFGQELHSFVLHQRAMLAKKLGQWGGYEHFLEAALKKNPFNLIVKLPLAKQRLHKGSIEDVINEFNKMNDDHSGDEISLVQILSEFGTMLMKKGDKNRAVVRYEKAMEKAFKFCQRNPDEKSQRIKFSYEVNIYVNTCVQQLRDYWKSDIQNPKFICKLGKLEYNLRNYYLTRSYCKDALKMALDENQKSEIVCILVEIEIDISTDIDTLAEVDKLLNTLTPSANSNHQLKELGVKLAYKSAILHERLYFTDALTGYANVAESGHVGAITRLLTAVEIMDKTSSKFYEMCAFIHTSIMSIQLATERDSVGERLRTVLKSAVSGDLKRLREQQFEMEKALLSKSCGPEYNPATVIQTSRNLLNYAMHGLAPRYRQRNSNAENTIDFFCIHRNFDKQQTEAMVRSKFKQYKWENIDVELINFFVEIQPCTNPRANNWIMAFMEFNNTDKHQRQNKQYGKYKVYPEDQGAQPGVYQDTEYYSVELARTVCNNIAYILDNLNGFSLIF